jgi:hypothetical protein
MKAYLFSLLLFPLVCFSQQKAKYPDVVLLNNKLDGTGKLLYADVIQILGISDSIVRTELYCGSFFESTDSLLFFHRTVFEKQADTLIFKQMDFAAKSSDFVHFGNIKLTTATTRSEIEAQFVVLFNDNVGGANDYINGKKTTVGIIDSGLKDQVWYLWFCDDKAVRLELRRDC